jgi:membrane protein YqaA with SNARE-associated domain
LDLLFDPLAWILVLLVTALSLGLQLASHALGQKGWHAVEERFPKFQPEQWERAQAFIQERGRPALLLTALPGVGMLLSAAAGALEIPRSALAFWATLGLLARNWLVVVGAGELYTLFR